jgi:hypothetical protein
MLAFGIISGQLPYQSAYCRMMKHSIDADMMQRCTKHRVSENRVSQLRLVPQRMMKVFVKPMLAAFEHHRAGNVSLEYHMLDLNLVVANNVLVTGSAVIVHNTSPPPSDINILTLNLRI